MKEMKKVKIYTITCTQGFQMAEQGTNYSLTPWGNDTVYYKGFDDGGKDYELPEGFEVAETNDGTPAIYKGNDHYDLYKQFNSPAITNGFETHMLKLVK
jgi:hypothetical protein